MEKDKLFKAAGVLAGASALTGAALYGTTRVLVRMALDREPPKVMEKAGSRISGTLVDEEIRRIEAEGAKRLLAEPTTQVEISGFDGTRLVGHWYPAEEPERLIVAMHGWRSAWYRDFGIISEFYHANHCSVLFAEQRGQGSSGGDYIGFGVTERFDCMDWVRWAAAQAPELPIYLCGVSMGATTVLMADGLGLPEQVHGIMADCGFTSPDEIWRHIADNNLHIAYTPMRSTIAALYEKKTLSQGFDYSTVEALRAGNTPVLLVHGTDDHFVPVEMTYRNYLACSAPKRLLIVPGADHGMSYLVERERYQQTIRDFWRDFDGKDGPCLSK